MSFAANPWYHANKYTAASSCEECGGVVYHEHWCSQCNGTVAYARQVVLDDQKLSLADRLILHALGVIW